MAFPSRFGVAQIPQPTFVPVYGAPMIPMVQSAPYLVPSMPGGMIASVNPRGIPGGRHRGPHHHDRPGGNNNSSSPMDNNKGGGGAPTTTVFVGNISEKATNELIKTLLARCGTILNWKRVQGPTGRFQAFGFCEYDHPDSTLRAVRLLHNWKLGDKALTVKVDEKTKDILREYVNKRRQVQGKTVLKCEGDELPCDEEMKKEDESFRKSLEEAILDLGPDLLEGNDGAPPPRARTPELYGKGGNLDIQSLDRERKEYIAREINSFRQTYSDDKEAKNKERQHERDRDRDRHHRDHRNRGGDRDRGDYRRGGGGDDRSRQESASNRKRALSPSPQPPSNVLKQESSSMAPTLATSIPTAAPAGTPTMIAGTASRPESRPSSIRARSPSPQGSATESQHAGGGAWMNRNRRRDSSPELFKGGRPKRSRSRSRLGGESDEDDIERRRLERKMREKDASYQERLQHWEGRERKRTKEYERERLKQRLQRKEELREGKKLKEFLEDYDDERDDSKYYKGKSYDMRRRDYEKEREMDNKDRQREKDEYEDIRKKLLEEGVEDPEKEIAKVRARERVLMAKKMQKEQDEKLSRRMNMGDSSESPSPVHRPTHQVRSGTGDAGSVDMDEDRGSSTRRGDDEDEEEGERRSRSHERKQSRFVPANDETPSVKPMGFGGLKLSGGPSASGGGSSTNQSGGVPTSTNSNEDDDDVDDRGRKRSNSRRLVPLEYTDEERMAVDDSSSDKLKIDSKSQDDKKRLIKSVIEKIPTNKEDLFAFTISWNQVDQALIDRRLKPWITKKIVEYIGEDEQSLVEFICQKITQHTPAQTIIEDISMVLDEEAGVFVVKLWRLLIYEIEAKKLGLVKTDGVS